jgi:outer membrane immunogenic protein
MRKLLPGSMALFALGLSMPAMAGDLEVAAPAYKATPPVVRSYDWTGFYVGGNVGGHWGTDKITTTTDADFEGLGGAGGAAIDAASLATLNPKGLSADCRPATIWRGGGVFGIEVDANWLDGSATRTLTIPVISPLDVMTNDPGLVPLHAADALGNSGALRPLLFS